MTHPRLLPLDDDHPFTGRHMLAGHPRVLRPIIAVNVAMVVAATGTWPGLVVENSYVASQDFNELARKRPRPEARRAGGSSSTLRTA